jgi:hypothetical protein
MSPTRPRRPEAISQALAKLLPEGVLEVGLKAIIEKDLETATYVHDYLQRLPEQKLADQLKLSIIEMGDEPISFLPQAHEITQWYRSRTEGSFSVYIILLEGMRKSRYGLYVGQTWHPIEHRFEQHLSGGRLAARCHRKMKQLLPSLFGHFSPMSRQESLELEQSLIIQFESAGIETKGA